MKHIRKDYTGQRFGRLTALKVNQSPSDVVRWVCICDCGNTHVARQQSLHKGNTKSCGCLQGDSLRERLTKHGDCTKKEYLTWQGIKSRCNNPNNPRYKDYGGRGIQMCERWLNSYENFLLDVGKAPSLKQTIDRIRVNEGYSKENCRWSTQEVQANNRRNNRYVLFEGKLTTVANAARLTGIDYNTFSTFARKGTFSNLMANNLK